MRIISLGELGQSITNERGIKDLKVGDIVKGRVVNNENGIITIKTAGEQLLTVLFLSNENLQEGSIINFVVNQITEDKIYARVIKSNNTGNRAEKDINFIINELGIEKNELNKDIVKNLLKFLQPIDKDKIEYVNLLLKSIDNIKQNNDDVLINLLVSEENILELPIDTINKLCLSINIQDYYDTLLYKPESISSSGDEEINYLIKNISEIFYFKQNTIDSLEKLIHQAYKSVYSTEIVDLETISYLLSKDIEITPQNLYIFNNLILKGKGLDDYLISVIDILNNSNGQELKNYSKELSKIFLEADKVHNKSYNNQINNIINIMKKIEEILERKDLENFDLKENIHNLKSILFLIKSVNQHINYYNIPLYLNNQDSSVDIYIYKDGKRGKKVDLTNVSILISMELKNAGHIESLIHVSNRIINIIFKTENKTISGIINQHSNILKEALENKGYSANISVDEKKVEKTNLLSFESKLNNKKMFKHGIDVRL